MKKRTVTGILFILTVVFLIGCAIPPMPWPRTGWDYYPPDKIYTVFGRVTNFHHQPVSDCRVILIRQKSGTDSPEQKTATGAEKPGKLQVAAEFVVATTSKSGDFSFNFEPWGAYDVWLYFDAMDQGYQGQMVQLSPLIRSYVMRGQGRNPIAVDVLLEPIQDEETRRLVTSSK